MSRPLIQTDDVLAAMSPHVGYSAADLARQLEVSGQRLRGLLSRLLHDGKIEPQQNKLHLSSSRRPLYVLANHFPANEIANHQTTQPPIINTQRLLETMQPGVPYALRTLSSTLRATQQVVERLLRPLIADGHVVRRLRNRSTANSESRTSTYTLVTPPCDAMLDTASNVSATAAAQSVFDRPPFDSEYHRLLTYHWGLCDAVRRRR